MNLPTTAGEFLDAIKDAPRWKMEMDAEDGHPVFWIAFGREKTATVTFEFDALWVNLYFDSVSCYDFELSRLNEDYPDWSWLKQIREKSWVLEEHKELVYRLEKMFPPINKKGK